MQTANLIKDIRVERFHKIDMGLKALEGPITVKLNNVSAMECNIIRHFFQGALNHFYRLAQVSVGQLMPCLCESIVLSVCCFVVLLKNMLPMFSLFGITSSAVIALTCCYRWRSQLTWVCWELPPVQKQNRRTDLHQDSCAGLSDDTCFCVPDAFFNTISSVLLHGMTAELFWNCKRVCGRATQLNTSSYMFHLIIMYDTIVPIQAIANLNKRTWEFGIIQVHHAQYLCICIHFTIFSHTVSDRPSDILFHFGEVTWQQRGWHAYCSAILQHSCPHLHHVAIVLITLGFVAQLVNH